MTETPKLSHNSTELGPETDVAFQLGNKDHIPEWLIVAARESKAAVGTDETAQQLPVPELSPEQAKLVAIQRHSANSTVRRPLFLSQYNSRPEMAA